MLFDEPTSPARPDRVAPAVRAARRPRVPWTARAVFEGLRPIETGCLTVVLPGGECRTFGDPRSELRPVVRVNDARVFGRVIRGGDVAFGESYVDGLWDCEDLAGLFRLFHENRTVIYSEVATPGPVRRLANRIVHLARANTRRGSRSNIAAHYDLGDRLFELFLDPTMSYSSGIWSSGDDSLEQAQRNKIDSILHKAAIEPGHKLLEIGCGWGALSVEAAGRTGCRATGITLSDNQLAGARRRAERAFLDGRARFEHRDYRDVEGRYDRIVSVEMLEAVGHDNLGRFFAACDRALAPGGRAVIQVITVPDDLYEGYRRGCDWLQKFIFPGGLAPSLAALRKAIARDSSLSIESVEDIGPHYARTLRAWRERFESATDALEARGYDARFRRMWRYYLAYCEGGFAGGTFGDLQVVLTKPGGGGTAA